MMQCNNPVCHNNAIWHVTLYTTSGTVIKDLCQFDLTEYVKQFDEDLFSAHIERR